MADHPAWVGGGCYNSSPEHACRVTCGVDQATGATLCPTGLACNAGMCTRADGTCPAPPEDASRPDAPRTPFPDASPGSACYGKKFQVCFDAAPTDMPAPISGVISTDDAAQCAMMTTQNTGDAICVISGADITLGVLRVTGSRPLVVVAADQIILAGDIDVAADDDGTRGAGSPSSQCGFARPAAAVGLDVGGGAGGSFGTAGGYGGTSKNAFGGEPAVENVGPTNLTAGCDGQFGAAVTNQPIYNAGQGGGAFYAIAGNSIIESTFAILNASGGGAPPSGGPGMSVAGGGGGSGGLVGFDAPTIIIQGYVVANGGGGAAGSQDGSGGGGSPDPTMPSTPALGGVAGAQIVGGGTGGVDAANGGDAVTLSSGLGDGGGGGVGYILVHGGLSGGTYSPQPTPVP